MKSILGMTLSAEAIWQTGFLILASFLLFNPPLANPLFTAIALGGGLVLTLFSPNLSMKPTHLGFLAWAFLSYALLSFIWSSQPGVSLVSAGFLFLAVLLFLSQAGWGKKTQERVELFGLLLALAAAVMGLEQRFFGLPALTQVLPSFYGEELDVIKAAIHNQRAFGPLVTPGALAALMIFFFPQAFIRAQIASGTKKNLFYLAALVLTAGLWSTQSVGALASMTLAVLIILAIRKSYKALGWVLGLGLAGVLYLIAQRGLYSWHLAAFSMRLELWNKAWQLFLMKPWLGWGLGCFGEAYQNLGYDPNTGSRYAHDLPLQVLVELGLPGLVLLLIAVFSILKRVKPQPRWEAWGVGTGLLSVLFFSLVDLPFQMPELAVLFAATAGRIELKNVGSNTFNFHFAMEVFGERLRERKIFGFNAIEWILLAVFLITGFWPPFRPWNFALLAVTLWAFAGLSGKTHDRISLWTLLGVSFFILRALASPSASGCVRFFELSGILLAFATVFPALPNKERFLKAFGFLGLIWALKVWWETFHYNEGGFSGWIHFQFSDVKDWIIFPNPKQIGLFLIPLLFLPFLFRHRKALWAASAAAFLTALRLKSGGALLGFFAGLSCFAKKKFLPWILGTGVVLLLGILALRAADPSSTKWGRFEIWDSALKVFAMNPILGQGPGAFAGLYHQVKEPREGGVSRYLMDARYAHNEVLELLAAFGLVGFTFLSAWLFLFWPGKDKAWNRVSALGLGAASLTDFCFHTPLIALWGTAFLNFKSSNDSPPRHQDTKKTRFLDIGKTSSPRETPFIAPNLTRGFLVLGIALGLFAVPVFIPQVTDKFESAITANQLPQALRYIQTAQNLNPWDMRLTAQKMDFLEKLYLSTGDPTWKQRADDAQDHLTAMEGTDGSLRFEKAQRLVARYNLRPDAESLNAAKDAWEMAQRALPFNAFVRFEKGMFYYGRGPGKSGIWNLTTALDGAEALRCFQQAQGLEPNFAQAWYYSALCRKGMGDPNYTLDEQKAYEVYDRYQSAERIDPLEKLLVSLTPEQLQSLRQELNIK